MKPVIFSTPMVQAILSEKKTQTRRVIKPQPTKGVGEPLYYHWKCRQLNKGSLESGLMDFAPCKRGDVLWVRETWSRGYTGGEWGFVYKADSLEPYHTEKWHPSIHMPREAARLFLRVTGVRVEQLQDISPEDIVAEGLPSFIHKYNEHPHNDNFGEGWLGFEWFRDLWNSLNIKRGFGWETNPWAWVYEFERIEKGMKNNGTA